MYCAAVNAVPLALKGPDTAANCGSAASCRSAAATAAAAAQTGWRSRNTMMVGLAADCGKCSASSALPSAESLPGGAVAAPPNPAAR